MFVLINLMHVPYLICILVGFVKYSYFSFFLYKIYLLSLHFLRYQLFRTFLYLYFVEVKAKVLASISSLYIWKIRKKRNTSTWAICYRIYHCLTFRMMFIKRVLSFIFAVVSKRLKSLNMYNKCHKKGT